MARVKSLRYDHLKMKWTLICSSGLLTTRADYSQASASCLALISQLFGPQPGHIASLAPCQRRSMRLDFKSNVCKDDFLNQVRRAKE
jgi:hypothetical protein